MITSSYGALHFMTRDYVAVRVHFNGSDSKPYWFKANANLGLVLGDHVVVNVLFSNEHQLKCCAVAEVRTQPHEVLSNHTLYKWIICKVDFTVHADRNAADQRFITTAQHLEASRQARELQNEFMLMYGDDGVKRLGAALGGA